MKFETEAEKIMYEALTEISKYTPEESYDAEYDIYVGCGHCDEMIYTANEAINKIKKLKEEIKNG